MKVLVVSKSFSKGGSASGALNLGKALEEAGCEVVYLDAFESQKKTFKGFVRGVERVVDRFLYDAETHCFKFAPSVFDLVECYENYKPDVIQLCDISGNVISFKDFEKVACPIVHRMSDFWPYHGPSHYEVYRKKKLFSDCFFESFVFDGKTVPHVRVSPSHWLAESLSVLNEEKKDSVRVIKNAVAFPNAKPKVLPSKNSIRFGFVSSSILDPRKGFLALPSLLSELSDQGITVSLHLHGRVDASSIPEIPGVKVIYYGAFSRDSLVDVYNSFDVLLCPSRLDNSPNVVCEAMAHGRPVIAQQRTGAESYVTGGGGGIMDFYGAGKELEFLRCSREIMSSYYDFSAASLAHVYSELSYGKIGKEYVSLYSELIGRV